jgi:uncharacterized protein YcbK (DUF882 family)
VGDISEHFRRQEFECKCGCGFDPVDVELVKLCELVRKMNGGIPITPNCGSRCAFHNDKVGGSSRSQHLIGKACDLPVKNPLEIYWALDKLYSNKYGFGVYDNFIHVDVRAKKARWSEIDDD